MGRSKGIPNVTEAERRSIRLLYRQGVRIAEIVKRTGRSESVVYRVRRDLHRKKPTGPPGRHAARDRRIVTLVGRGMMHKEVAEMFGLTVRRVGQIVENDPGVAKLVREAGWRVARVARLYRLRMVTVMKIARGRRKTTSG